MTVSDNTIAAEGFCDFCKPLGEETPNASKVMAEMV